MENTMEQSYAEIYNIINHLDKDLYKKIPISFINFIKQNMDLDYKCNIDFSKDINSQQLLHNTRVILSLIYRDYLCSTEERKILIEKDNLELIKHQEELREKYNPDNIFKNSNEEISENTVEQVQNNQVAMVEYKETLFTKIMNRIKKLFKL